MKSLRLRGWRVGVLGFPPCSGFGNSDPLVLRIQFVPLKPSPRTFHGRQIDFVHLRVPMLRHAVDAPALPVAVEAQLRRDGDRLEIVPHDIDLALQVVQHRSGSRGRVHKERFRLGDSPQVVGADLLDAEIESTLPLGGLDRLDVPLVEQLEDAVLHFDVQHHDAVEKLLDVAHVAVADRGFLFVEHAHSIKSAQDRCPPRGVGRTESPGRAVPGPLCRIRR